MYKNKHGTVIEKTELKTLKQKLTVDCLFVGVTPDVIPGQKTIDNMNPSSKEEFNEFQRLLTEKITKYEVSHFSFLFL